MDWIINNFPETLMVIGIILLIIEVVILGFATFFLFFIGLAAIATSVLMWFGIVDDAWLPALSTWAVLSLVFTALLWRKLKGLQADSDHTPTTNDIVGYTFTLKEDVSPLDENDIDFTYSGIKWKLVSDTSLSKGTVVKVVETQVGILKIAPSQ